MANNKSPLHLLVIPSFYPTKEDPLLGVFFKEQALMIRESGVQLGVIYPEIRPLKSMTLGLLSKNYFQSSHATEEAIPTLRLHGWNLFPGFLKGTMHYWINRACFLFEKYIRLHGKPDLIHAQSAIWAGTAARKISQIYGIPYVLTEHRDNFLHKSLLPNRPHDQWLEKAMRDVLDQASQVIAVSHALQKGLSHYMHLPKRKVQILPNFIDTDFFCPLPSLSLNSPFTFLTLAHLVKSKNISLLLEAFQLLLKKDPDNRLKIGGDGPERTLLEEQAWKLSIESQVEFLGRLDRHQVRQAFSTSQVFVLPSQYETFGIVFIEALAMGLPVIGTSCGGPEDIITREVGELVSPNDRGALMASMSSLKQNFKSYSPVKMRQHAIDSFGKAAIVNKQLAIYLQCIR